jgi:hypothetical protein
MGSGFCVTGCFYLLGVCDGLVLGATAGSCPWRTCRPHTYVREPPFPGIKLRSFAANCIHIGMVANGSHVQDGAGRGVTVILEL